MKAKDNIPLTIERMADIFARKPVNDDLVFVRMVNKKFEKNKKIAQETAISKGELNKKHHINYE